MTAQRTNYNKTDNTGDTGGTAARKKAKPAPATPPTRKKRTPPPPPTQQGDKGAPLKYLIICADDTLIPEAERAKLSQQEQNLIQASIYIGKLERLRSVKRIINDKNKTWKVKQAICMAASICPEYGIGKSKEQKGSPEEKETENIVWEGGQRENTTTGTLISHTPLLNNAEIWGNTSGAFDISSIYWLDIWARRYTREGVIESIDEVCHSEKRDLRHFFFLTKDRSYWSYKNELIKEAQKTKLIERTQGQLESIFSIHARNDPFEYITSELNHPIGGDKLVQFFVKTAHELGNIPEWLDDYKNRKDIIQWLDKNKDMPCIAEWLDDYKDRHNIADWLTTPCDRWPFIDGEYMIYDIYNRGNNPKNIKAAAAENAQRMREYYKENIPLLDEVLAARDTGDTSRQTTTRESSVEKFKKALTWFLTSGESPLAENRKPLTTEKEIPNLKIKEGNAIPNKTSLLPYCGALIYLIENKNSPLAKNGKSPLHQKKPTNAGLATIIEHYTGNEAGLSQRAGLSPRNLNGNNGLIKKAQKEFYNNQT